MIRNHTKLKTIGLAASALLMAATAQATEHEASPRSWVYTMSNAADGNEILAFAQDDAGLLSAAGEFPTGGLGTGGGLGNQGALAHDGEFLFAVNAGSNEISVLRFADGELQLVDVAYSGGDRPVSVTIDRGILYVLNAGSDSIAGFTVDSEGLLEELAGSVRTLSGVGTAAAQIGFSDDGTVLIVTERATNSLVTFDLDRSGVPAARQVFASPGVTPFGFAVAPGRRIYVAEASGGAPGASTVTSWRVAPDGTLDVLTPAEPTFQAAACWAAITPDGRFIYTSNTGSSTISALRVRGGDLELLHDGVAGDPGAGARPIDLVITPDGRYLHSLNGGIESIASFAIAADGSLEYLGEQAGLPDGANGLAVR